MDSHKTATVKNNNEVLANDHVPWACEAFSKHRAEELITFRTLHWCWTLFMIKLWNHGLLNACTMNKCSSILERSKKTRDRIPSQMEDKLTQPDNTIVNLWIFILPSKVGPVEWLKPYTDVTIVELGKRGVKSLLAVPISFVSEHIETLEEIDVEYKELALESGIEKWGRVPALGYEPSFISDLADAVIESLPYVGAMAVSNVNARQSLVPLGSIEELFAAYNSTDIIIRDASPVTVITSEAIESHLTKTTKDISKATKAPTKVKKMGEDLKRKALTEATNFQQSNAIEITRKISNEPSRNFVSKTDIHPSP
ncbi:hypothetical protein KIW84_020621 [Lathyrus oleraceus]|uniref:Polycomb protein VEFS-Box domain-containing protein n=1 Tax=Pisum sativum TaxID=3888 RepID=A0A9D4Y673_PEA|nr:hypothetical protein KIW84_020621 [Pisum sativum]